MDKPVTQREIANQRKSKADEPRITVENLKRRILTLQLRDQSADFYIGERSIQIGPHKSLTERKSLFNSAQLSNLRAKGDIRVVGDIA